MVQYANSIHDSTKTCTSVLYWANRQSAVSALYGIDVWLFRLQKTGLARVRENVRFYQTINVTRLIVLENYVRNFGRAPPHTFAHVYTTQLDQLF